MESTALFTDHYELTMLEASLESGAAHRRSCFEIFARFLPPGRSYGVTCGAGRIVDALQHFTFDSDVLEYLRRTHIVQDSTLRYLKDFRFEGDIYAYRDGELFFPNSPIARVVAPFGQALLIETLLLSIFNFDSAVASAAARMVQAAKGHPLIEMGSRRTHERAAVAAARAAYLCGFSSTSNLEAGRTYNIPTAGTAGHALILAHNSEEEAFVAQLATQGTKTTALVDTFNVEEGIRKAIGVFGPQLNAIRIDSGNLEEGVIRARSLLDDLGAYKTAIILSGDLDEYAIAELTHTDVDGFGVGSKLVGGSGYPSANLVYKMVAIEDSSGKLRPVEKLSENKGTSGGPKGAVRLLDFHGMAIGEITYDPTLGFDDLQVEGIVRDLQAPLFLDGRPTDLTSIEDSRQHHIKAIGELRDTDRLGLDGAPAIEVQFRHQDKRSHTSFT